MSLKFVHQIIIFAGISVSLITAWFCFFDDSTAGSVTFKIGGFVCLAATVGLIAYEIHFLKRTKRLIIQ